MRKWMARLLPLAVPALLAFACGDDETASSAGQSGSTHQGGAAGGGNEGGGGGGACGPSGCPAPEICDNGTDDDSDGLADCADPDCEGPACGPDESLCDNAQDDDNDGLIDCEDATACQMLPECAPGTVPVGDPCSASSDCAANNGDPFCVSEALMGWSEGYCSEFCDLAASDCPGGTLCFDVGFASGNGLCFETCASPDACRPWYSCQDLGASSDLCVFGAYPENNCADFIDNDADYLIDCADPDACKTLPACVPGNGPTGAACTANTDCVADDSDPVCLTEAAFFAPGGYCSQVCDPALNDCPGDGICLFNTVLFTGICLDGCATDADCRPGYYCAATASGSFCGYL